jgi:hypothetical protein
VEGIPTFQENELIEAEVRFRYEQSVDRVVAVFMHQGDPYVRHTLAGDVVSQSGDVGLARLGGLATVIKDAYGEYRCESLHVEFADRRRIAFEPVPDLRFSIARAQATSAPEQPGSKPELLRWDWA